MKVNRNNLMFMLQLAVNLIMNFDTGIIPAAEIKMEKDLQLNYERMALIGSLDYLGISLGSIVLPFYVNKLPIRILLAIYLILNALMSVIIGLTY